MIRSSISTLLAMLAIALPSVLAQEEFVFEPAFSEFRVTFPAKPTVSDIQSAANDGGSRSATKAELLLSPQFFRAEVVQAGEGLSDLVSEDFALNGLKQYAAHNGLEHTDMSFEQTALGAVAKLRGTKILNNDGKAVAVTYEARCYYGDKTMMSVYSGAPSIGYPSEEVARFHDSIQRTR